MFREIPKEIYKEYIKYWNEVQNDKNEFHPKKLKSPDFTLKDLLDRVKDMKDEKDIFYMYTFFDKENIAAYCSVCIETIDN